MTRNAKHGTGRAGRLLPGLAGSAAIACLAVGAAPQAQTQTASDDRVALVDLYESTDGENWTSNTRWLDEDEELGRWYGVWTNSADKVTELRLGGNGLSGSMPASIGDLDGLRKLSLRENPGLTGAIPAEFGNLTNLVEADFYGSGLTGPIPPEFGDLSSLKRVYTWGNSLSGSLPPELGNLSSITRLLLGKSELSGSIPPELGNLSTLEWLTLSYNNLSGSIPSELGNLPSLEWLNLMKNGLTGTLPAELANATTLERLFLSDNQLTGEVPASFTALNLKLLWIYNNDGLCVPRTAEFDAWIEAILRDGIAGGSSFLGDRCPPPMPGQPAAPALTAGAGQVTVAWSAPTEGGPPETYDVETTRAGAGWSDSTLVSGLTGVQTVVGDLANGTRYAIRVRAVNEGGEGPWSSTAYVTPTSGVSPPGAPAAPTLTGGDAQVTAAWAPPAAGGPADTYDADITVAGAGWDNRTSVTGLTDTTTVFGDLTNGLGYAVRVRAVNAEGEGPWSPTAYATPASGSPPPEAPAVPTLTAGVGQVTAEWSAPPSGAPADTFDANITVAGTGWSDATWVHQHPDITYVFDGLTNGTNYAVRVRANNSAGEPGPWSPTAYATPAVGLDGLAQTPVPALPLGGLLALAALLAAGGAWRRGRAAPPQ